MHDKSQSYDSNRASRRSPRALVVAPCLMSAVLALGILVPRAASAIQSAELYRTDAAFYGRYEARIRYAPGEGVVSSFFLWKDGSSSTTSWNELDYEKINATCRLQTNIWTGKGTQSAVATTPTVDICGDYHTYTFEWTPDYISWAIDGTQLRKVTGANVTEYTQNAAAGMAIHFNVWNGDSSFGGTLNAATLPVRQFINWVQYSSYTNGAFQMKWREDFNGTNVPDGWGVGDWTSPLKHSTHNPLNVTFANGIAVLSMTADNATGFSGTPPADASGGGGASGTGGAPATGGAPGTGGSASTGGTGPAGGSHGGTGGIATGTGGTSSAGGNATGGASAGTGGTSGSGGTVATGGASSGTGGGATATGGATPGTGGNADGSGSGCGCRAGGQDLSAGGFFVAVMLLATRTFRRRRS